MHNITFLTILGVTPPLPCVHANSLPSSWRVTVGMSAKGDRQLLYCPGTNVRLLLYIHMCVLFHAPDSPVGGHKGGQLTLMSVAMRPLAATAAARDVLVRAVEQGSSLVAVPQGT